MIEEKTEQVYILSFHMRWMTNDEVANKLEISYNSAYEFIHHRLDVHKVCARWVSKKLV
jgi:hypothetical protein